MWKGLVFTSRYLMKYVQQEIYVQSWRSYITVQNKLKVTCPQNAQNGSLTFSSGRLLIQDNFITLDGFRLPHPTHINLIWLRDHCRCSDCYNYTTNQRKQSILDNAKNASVKHFILEDEFLKITWVDNHFSTYSLEWLQVFCNYEKITTSPIFWKKDNVESLNISSVDLNKFLHSDKGVVELLSSIIQFGVGFIKNVPPTKIDTEQVIQKISHVQRTFFGDMWEFSDSLDHQDTAYTRDALGAHTDNTYFSEAAGLQVLHCIHHDGHGGETLLVDGFNAANCLKKNHPQSYNRLTKNEIESEYIEKDRYYLASGPILKINSQSGELEQIRFNMYDRAPLKTISMQNMQQFYEDFMNLSSIILDPTSEWWLKLQPGTVLVFNNWRVLHGRAAYTGHRKIVGCYIGYSDWCSKARILGLL